MKTCKTCLYFGQYPWLVRQGLCEHPSISPSRDVSVSERDGIGYYDAESGPVTMGEDFGCIHHKDANATNTIS